MSSGPSPSCAPRRDKAYLGLEGLRGVAALMIVVRHGSDLFGVAVRSSHLAVDLFFVLSGFVLAHAYETRLRSGLGPLGFLRLRLIRLYPLYLLALGLSVAFHLVWRFADGDPAWSGHQLAQALALNGLFLPYRGPAVDIFPLDMPAWSLFFELLANLLFAAVAPILTTRRLCGATALAALALGFTAVHYGSLNVGWRWGDMAGGFARVLFAFPAGVLLHRLFGDRRSAAVPAWAPSALLLAVLAVDAGNWQGLYEASAALLIMPALVVAAALSRPAGALGRAYALLGAASYGVYVLHLPLLSAAKWALQRAGAAPLPPLSGGVFLAALIGAVLLLDRLYDLPLRRRLARGLGRPPVTAAAAP